MNVSVIIPTLNEATTLARTLDHLIELEPEEIIIADGGSTDGTREVANRYPVCWVSGPAGRASQMNNGATRATGELLLFLHADTLLEPAGFSKMKAAMNDGPWVGGAYSLKIISPQRSLRLISHLANLRSRTLNLAYGDQAFFVRTDTFRRLDGFQQLPICEDLDFFRRLKSEGSVLLLRHKANTSARRWEHDGVLYCTVRNSLIASAFLLGCSPKVLCRWYPPRR